MSVSHSKMIAPHFNSSYGPASLPFGSSKSRSLTLSATPSVELEKTYDNVDFYKVDIDDQEQVAAEVSVLYLVLELAQIPLTCASSLTCALSYLKWHQEHADLRDLPKGSED